MICSLAVFGDYSLGQVSFHICGGGETVLTRMSGCRVANQDQSKVFGSGPLHTRISTRRALSEARDKWFQKPLRLNCMKEA